MSEHNKCTELARIACPWGGEILHYCPVHANQLAALAQHLQTPFKAKLLDRLSLAECESKTPLSDEEKELSKTFNL